MIEVNWLGKEKEFETVEEAENFSRELNEKGYGSDIWVNNKLFQSIIINGRTGESVLFIYTPGGNVGIKI